MSIYSQVSSIKRNVLLCALCIEGNNNPKMFFCTCIVSFLALVMVQESYADPIDLLRSTLPKQIREWRAEPDDRLFDPETIFEYINGGGELYRAYNMRRCLSRRYSNPDGPAIVLDIFDMGSSQDAFGVFTHDQEGEALQVGQGGLYRSGWLRFWKGRFFCSIYSEAETPAAEKAVRELARVVALLLRDEGPKPGILSRLPAEGLRPRSIRYLHHQTVLNYHFYLADRNILNLGPRTDAVLATYQRGEEIAHLLLVLYPDAAEAEKAFQGFERNYLPDAGSTGLALLENRKWSGARRDGRLLVIVLDSDSKQLAERLLAGFRKDQRS